MEDGDTDLKRQVTIRIWGTGKTDTCRPFSTAA